MYPVSPTMGNGSPICSHGSFSTGRVFGMIFPAHPLHTDFLFIARTFAATVEQYGGVPHFGQGKGKVSFMKSGPEFSFCGSNIHRKPKLCFL